MILEQVYLQEFCNSPGYSAHLSYRHLQSRYVIWTNLEFTARLVSCHPVVLFGTDPHLKKNNSFLHYMLPKEKL